MFGVLGLYNFDCEMKKYNLVNKFGREYNNAFTLKFFEFLTEIYMKTPPIVTPLSI